MEIKYYLQQISFLDKEIKSLQEECDQYRSLLTSIRATDYSADRVSGGKSNDLIDRVVRYVDKNQEINRKIDELWDLKMEVSSMIDEVGKSGLIYSTILRDRYINGKRWEVIAVEQNYTIRNIYKLHGQALNLLEDIYQEKSSLKFTK